MISVATLVVIVIALGRVDMAEASLYGLAHVLTRLLTTQCPGAHTYLRYLITAAQLYFHHLITAFTLVTMSL